MCLPPPPNTEFLLHYCVTYLIVNNLSNLFIVDFTDKYPARAAYQAAALPKVSCTIIIPEFSTSDRVEETSV